MKRQADDYVDGLAAKGQPRIIAEHGRPFTVDFAPMDKMGDAGLRTMLPAILSWLHPEALKAQLHKAIEQMAKPSLVMATSARRQRLDGLEAELLLLARQEELLVERSEAAGEPIIRRPDCDVRALLGIGKAGEAKARPQKRVTERRMSKEELAEFDK